MKCQTSTNLNTVKFHFPQVLEAGLEWTPHPHNSSKGMVFLEREDLNSPWRACYEKVTRPGNNTSDLMLKTKVKSVPPSFKLCAEINVWEAFVVCAVGCEWQSSTWQTTAETSDAFMQSFNNYQHSLQAKLSETQEQLLKEESTSVGSCPLPTCIASYWHFHFLQGWGQCAYPVWKSFFFQLCSFKYPPGVLLHLQRDQPMPIRSNWNNYVK